MAGPDTQALSVLVAGVSPEAGNPVCSSIRNAVPQGVTPPPEAVHPSMLIPLPTSFLAAGSRCSTPEFENVTEPP